MRLQQMVETDLKSASLIETLKPPIASGKKKAGGKNSNKKADRGPTNNNDKKAGEEEKVEEAASASASASDTKASGPGSGPSSHSISESFELGTEEAKARAEVEVEEATFEEETKLEQKETEAKTNEHQLEHASEQVEQVEQVEAASDDVKQQETKQEKPKPAEADVDIGEENRAMDVDSEVKDDQESKSRSAAADSANPNQTSGSGSGSASGSSLSNNNSSSNSNSSSNNMPQIDLSFLAALPPDIQAELLSQQQMQVEAFRRHEEKASASASSTAAATTGTSNTNVATATATSSTPAAAQEAKSNSSSSASGSGSKDAKQVQQASQTQPPQSQSQAPQPQQTHTSPLDEDGPDPAFLEALPPELRSEVIAQHQAMSRRRRQAALESVAIDESRVQEMDQASVLATFDPRLRREWLLQQDESVLATLPSSILAEAVLLRHRANRPYIFSSRRSAASRSLMVPEQPAINNIQNANNNSGSGSASGSRAAAAESKVETPKVDPRLWIGREGESIVPHKLILALVERLCIFRFVEVSTYNRLLSAMCGYKVSRQLLFHTFMLMLNFGRKKKKKTKINTSTSYSDKAFFKLRRKDYWEHVFGFISSLPARMVGDDSVNFGNAAVFPAPLLVARILQVLTHLVSSRPHMMLHFFFKDSSEDIQILFGSVERRKSKSWLEQLFALYSHPPFCWSAKHVEILTLFLSEILLVRHEKKLEDKATATNEEAKAHARAHAAAAAGEASGASSSSATASSHSGSNGKGKGSGSVSASTETKISWKTSLIRLDMPHMNPDYLTAFVRAFQRDNCAEKVFNLAMKIARYLAEVDENKQGLLKEIGQTTRNLTKEIDADLNHCIASMPSSNSSNHESSEASPMMKFGGSLYKLSGRQTRLLRLLSFLDSMGVLDRKEEEQEREGEQQAKDQDKQADDKKNPSNMEQEEAKVTSKAPKASKASKSSNTHIQDSVAMIAPSMKKLWRTLDTYLYRLVPPKAQDSKHLPQRSPGKQTPNQKKEMKHGSKRTAEGQVKTTPIRGKRETNPLGSASKRRGSSTPKAKGSGPHPSMHVDLEEDDSDVSQLMQLLPLIESYFIVNAPKNANDIGKEAFKDFRRFTHTHSRILNVFCQKKPMLMQRTLKSLLWHPKKILNFNNKHTHFLTEIRKQRASSGSIGSFRILIRRERLFEDSYHQFQQLTNDELKSTLSVKFHAEAGVDAGGLTREWFLLLSRAIFNPNYCLFVAAADNNNVFQPSKYSHINPEHLLFFKFVGRFVGKAIYDGQLLDAYFTRSFYKHLLGAKPTISDVESIDPEYYKSLKWMLDNPIEGVFELNFTREAEVFGVKRVTELKENGENIQVTDENKHEYVKLMAEQMLTADIKKQIDAFLQGFREIIDAKLLSIFNEQELELLICGLPDIDVHDLKANTEYKGINASSKLIRWFWQVVDDMTQEEKALLVQFVTGTSKVPIQGFKELQGMNGIQRFQIHKASGVDRLPTAHTCFNQLDLPGYSSVKSMRKNLLIAIREGSEGFAFR